MVANQFRWDEYGIPASNLTNRSSGLARVEQAASNSHGLRSSRPCGAFDLLAQFEQTEQAFVALTLEFNDRATADLRAKPRVPPDSERQRADRNS
jgi:hypothetical protein